MTMLMKRSRDYAGVEAEAMANCLMLLAHVGRNSSSLSASQSKDLCSFQCKTCDKKFPSFQALGGHRASHKKPRLAAPAAGEQESSAEKSKMHRCSICGLEFSMGQALGGHMRRHRAAMMKEGFERPAVAAMAVPVLKRTTSSKRVFGFGLDLDLNLTPAENDDLKIESTPATPVLRCFI